MQAQKTSKAPFGWEHQQVALYYCVVFPMILRFEPTKVQTMTS